MTREEAAQYIQEHTLGSQTKPDGTAWVDVMLMAIEALKVEPCEDAISRQAAIDALGEKPLAWTEGEYELGLQNQWQSDVDALKALPSAQTEQRWIPCSEKYPDQDERVIVTIGGYDMWVWDCMPNRGDDYFWEDEQGFYHNKYEIDAWMPLPEPYIERRTND